MEFIARDQAIEPVPQVESSQRVGECTPFSQGRFLDELPGAAFGVVTLIWVVCSLFHLTW